MSLGLSVADVLANVARATPARTAVALDDDEVDFATMWSDGGLAAAGLQSAGLEPGDLVLVVGTVALDMVPVFVGSARAGIAFAPVDPRLPQEALDAIAELARPEAVVSSSDHVDTAAALANRFGVPHVRAIDLLVDEHPRPVEVEESDPHVVFFTSGTTGQSKGVVLSHRVSVLRSHPGALLQPRGPVVSPYPLFHMAGWTLALHQWHARGTTVMLGRADAPDIVDAVRRHQATRLNAIPGVWRRIVRHLDDDASSPLETLRFADTGTYSTPVDLLEAITQAAPNAHVRVFYGSTETGNVTMLEHDDIVARPGSCGVASPMVDLRVADGGELEVRTPLAFDGYLNDAEATAAAFDGAWFRTGDAAQIDGDGFVSIVGRLGTVIRTGGESVNPEQVEPCVASLPTVADAAVVGIPDEQWGEMVTAVVVVVDGSSAPTLDEVRSACGALAPHARPRRLEVVVAIPRTGATGQIDRSATRAAIKP